MLHIFRFIIALVFLTGSPALAQRAGSSPVDPNVLNINTIVPGLALSQNTNIVSLRALQSLNPAVKNLVAVVAGQSNCTDIVPSTYSPANPANLDQMFLNDGGIYNALDPVMGVSLNSGGGFVPLQMFDDLITAALFDRIVIVPVCIGGTSVADWQNGNQFDRITVAFSRLKAKGMANAGTNVTVIVLWMQGETDNIPLNTSQAAYTASFNAVVAASRTAGFTGPWFVTEETLNGGVVWAPVQAAQTAVSPSGVINNGAGVYTAGNLDALVGSTCGGSACRFDNTHFSVAGRTSVSSTIRAALHAFGAPF
jgi:hypothetical protein